MLSSFPDSSIPFWLFGFQIRTQSILLPPFLIHLIPWLPGSPSCFRNIDPLPGFLVSWFPNLSLFFLLSYLPDSSNPFLALKARPLLRIRYGWSSNSIRSFPTPCFISFLVSWFPNSSLLFLLSYLPDSSNPFLVFKFNSPSCFPNSSTLWFLDFQMQRVMAPSRQGGTGDRSLYPVPRDRARAFG
ncbi:MAG: hypothetical protein M3Y03_01980 [Verrucomicrobiota bacterium]|nr:hypothetical protein [Verrucomicrobiota bacterium]